MYDAAGIMIGFATLSAVGLGVGKLIDRVARKPGKPEQIPQRVWDEHTTKNNGGPWLGFLERSLFYGALWSGAGTLIAAWLAFKLASKWEVWKNVIRVPNDQEAPNEWFAATHTFGSWILQRFWIGTLLNLVLAMAAAAFGAFVGSLLG